LGICLGAATAHFEEIKTTFSNRNLYENMPKNSLFFRKKPAVKITTVLKTPHWPLEAGAPP